MKNIVDSSTDQEIVELTKMLNQNFFSGTNCCLCEILASLTEAKSEKRRVDHPFASQISRYFFQMHPVMSSEPPRIGFTEEGVDRIMEKKLAKKGLSLQVPRVFPFDNLTEQMETFYKSSESSGIFLVDFGAKFSGHYSPLIVERIGDQLYILNTDSVGPKGSAQFHEKIVEQLASLSFPTSLYVLDVDRQKDESSCRMFSMRDALEAAQIMATSPRGFFSFFSEHSELSKQMFDGVPVTRVSTLPAEMLKLTQSMKPPAIPQELTRPLPSHKGSATTLTERIGRQSYIGYKFVLGQGSSAKTHRKMNLAAAIRAAKYFEELLEELVPSGASTTPTH
jgi:hypothetical protein